MKLFEHPENDKTLDRLPEFPSDVTVPDDISGLEPPTTLRPTAGGVRWMRWLAAIVLLGGAGVLTAALLRSNDVEETPVDYMETYDNPIFVEGGADPGTVEIAGTENPMDLYGTDNPAFVPEPTYMDLYGTDNPVLVPEPTYMDLYGTDNPVLVPAAEVESVDTGEFMDLYGTDNPVLVEP